MQANEAFTKLIFFYGQQWSGTKKIKQLPFLEDCYTIAFTGASLTNSELGMHEVAAKEFNEHYLFWKTIARGNIKNELLSDNPSRLLKDLTARVLPVRQLIKLMDFANDTEKGIDWIDDLRKSPSLANRPQQIRGVAVKAIEMANSLVARNEVLQATTAHFEFLHSKNISASSFSKLIETERKRLDDAPAVIVSLAAAAV